jgi:hypothetical protein
MNFLIKALENPMIELKCEYNPNKTKHSPATSACQLKIEEPLVISAALLF